MNEQEASKEVAAHSVGGRIGGGYGLTLDVVIDMTSPVESISSPSHPIKLEIDG